MPDVEAAEHGRCRRAGASGSWPPQVSGGDEGWASLASLRGGRTVENLIANELRESILNGSLAPGSRLPIRDVAKQLGASVTPVRIALKQLAGEGLVDLTPHAGATVGQLTVDELEELLVTRDGIESWLAFRGAPNLTEEALADMVGALARLGRAVEAGDPREYLGVSWAMRVPCYAAAGRPRLFRRATDALPALAALPPAEPVRAETASSGLRTCSSASPRPATSATVPSPERSRTRASNGLSTTSSRRCSSPTPASPGGAEQRPREATSSSPSGGVVARSTLPGLRIPSGSKLALIALMSGIRSPCSCSSASILPRPMPCSPVHVPPRASASSTTFRTSSLGALDPSVARPDLHRDVEVAVAGMADDAGVEAEPVDLAAREPDGGRELGQRYAHVRRRSFVPGEPRRERMGDVVRALQRRARASGSRSCTCRSRPRRGRSPARARGRTRRAPRCRRPRRRGTAPRDTRCRSRR